MCLFQDTDLWWLELSCLSLSLSVQISALGSFQHVQWLFHTQCHSLPSRKITVTSLLQNLSSSVKKRKVHVFLNAFGARWVVFKQQVDSQVGILSCQQWAIWTFFVPKTRPLIPLLNIQGFETLGTTNRLLTWLKFQFLHTVDSQ